MERRRFGPTGSEIPVIGQGTWQIDEGDRAAVVAALRRGLDFGMNHIDTAEMYGDSEVCRRGDRRPTRRGFPRLQGPSPEFLRTGTIAACERSLARLRTDRLDCYLLHWRGEYPLEDTFTAFEQLQREGKILSWGVSNFDEPDLDEALEIAGEVQLTCNQVLYHLEERTIEHAVIPWCEAHGAAVVAYSPLGHGHFPGPNTKGGRVLREIAKAHGATPRQVALRFLVPRPRCSRSPRPPAPRTRPRTRGPATSG